MFHFDITAADNRVVAKLTKNNTIDATFYDNASGNSHNKIITEAEFAAIASVMIAEDSVPEATYKLAASATEGLPSSVNPVP